MTKRQKMGAGAVAGAILLGLLLVSMRGPAATENGQSRGATGLPGIARADQRVPGTDTMVDRTPGQADGGVGSTSDSGDGRESSDQTTQPSDGDGDGFADDADNCPNTPNPDQIDEDHDGRGNACDPYGDEDADGDGVRNADDNCYLVPNPDQSDTDNDGHGNACDRPDDHPELGDSPAPDYGGTHGPVTNTQDGGYSSDDRDGDGFYGTDDQFPDDPRYH